MIFGKSLWILIQVAQALLVFFKRKSEIVVLKGFVAIFLEVSNNLGDFWTFEVSALVIREILVDIPCAVRLFLADLDRFICR